MDRWLTLTDACFEFRLGARAVMNLVRSGQLVAVRLSKRGKNAGALRILYPRPRIAHFIEQSRRHIEHVPLLSTHEVAEILGVTPGAVRQLKKRGHLHGSRVGKATLFTASDIRRFLFKREGKKRAGRRMYSAILVRWFRRLSDAEAGVDVQVLDCLLREVVAIPEPMKSLYVSEPARFLHGPKSSGLEFHFRKWRRE